MNTKEVGNLIKKLRKEKNLSQQQLADILGVSPKTISKWECSNGLPDITLLKKVSEVLGVTIDELLVGNQKQEKKKNKVSFIVAITVLFVSVLIIFFIVDKKNIGNKIEYNCEVIRTFHIEKIKNSNNENYLYITVSEYQVEGTYTIKMPKTISKDLEENSNYEFTFKTTKAFVTENIHLLFNNSEIINVKYSDKTGMEQVSNYNCN